MNFDTTDHVLWPYEPDLTNNYDEYDEADIMYSDYKLEKSNQQ